MRQLIYFLLLVWIAAGCRPETKSIANQNNQDNNMNVLSLMKKRILVDSSEILFREELTAENFRKDRTVRSVGNRWK